MEQQHFNLNKIISRLVLQTSRPETFQEQLPFYGLPFGLMDLNSDSYIPRNG